MLKTIGDVCQLLNGYSFKSEKYVDSGIRIIRIANVQKGFIEDNSPAFYPLETPGIENYMLKEGDLLISLTGNVGRVALLNKEMLPAALNQRVACLRIKDDSIYKNFLFHYLNSSKFENTCILESRGVAQKNMSTEWLKRQPIPNYTLQNQIKISKILDSIIEIINKKRQQLVEFDSLIKSRFVEMFGDVFSRKSKFKTKKIGELVISKVERASKYFDSESEIKYIDISSIDNSNNVITGYTQYFMKDAPSRAQQHVKKHDILISTVRPNLNNVAKVQYDFDNLVASSGFCVLRSTEIEPEYLFSFVSRNEFANYLSSLTTGASYPAVSDKDILNIEIPYPPKDKQLEFVNFHRQVDKLKFENEILYSISRFTINKQTNLLGYRGVTL
jgi:type I restriction enzyme S subunit